jgi:hypothetical protein
MSDLPKILDKNGQEIKAGETVRFFASKPGLEPRTGFARVHEFQEGALLVYIWVENWASYGQDPLAWPLTQKGGAWVADHVSEDGETNTLEKEWAAHSFEQPAEMWPEMCTAIVANFVEEEGLQFSLRGHALNKFQVADPNGLLGAFIYHAEERIRKVFGTENASPVVYFAHPNAMAYFSFEFPEQQNTNTNSSLYIYSHFLYDHLLGVAESIKKNPEILVDGAYPLDTLVGAWLDAARNKKINVLPYRPKTEKKMEKVKPTGGMNG